MNNYCYSAGINMHQYKKTFYYDDIEALNLTIVYPTISLASPQAEYKINKDILTEVNKYKRYVKDLYREAIKNYIEGQERGYPFLPYEAYMNYNITYNENCFLSLYFDRYQFTGGAHGYTLRASNTWELCCGSNLPLRSFFTPNSDYRAFLIDEITRQARLRQEEENIYFDDYPSLISQNFKEENFYLTPEGITIYFQQYDIAPYSTGIAEFTIPYSMISWRPNC